MRCVKYLMMMALAVTSIGCQETVKMEDFNVALGRINQLERDVIDFKQLHITQAEKFETLKNNSDSQEKQIVSNTEQLTQIGKEVKEGGVKRDSEFKTMNEIIEGEKASRVKIEGRISEALAADKTSRQNMEDRLSETIYERGLAMAQFRRILTEFLSMEKELSSKIIETQGTFDTELWNGRINKIIEALESLKLQD